MRKEDCLFCKILNGDIPSTTVYEDESFQAILDVSPAARGHVLILPKNHAADLFELPEEDASKIMILAKKIAGAKKVTKTFSGLKVFHLHVHVIPRFKDDAVDIEWEKGQLPEDPTEIADEIKANL